MPEAGPGSGGQSGGKQERRITININVYDEDGAIVSKIVVAGIRRGALVRVENP